MDPVILFFILGIMAGLLKSNLEIPSQVSKFLSLYLLMSLGLKGGFALASSSIEVLIPLSISLFLAIVTTLIVFIIVKKFLPVFDSAALAATYGSVSAVTFVTATQFLTTSGIAYGAYMAAAMALMESPAILIAVAIATYTRGNLKLWSTVKHSLVDGPHLLLIGSLIIGILSGPVGLTLMAPFISNIFKGLLAFFLLDMGIQVSKNLPFGLKNKFLLFSLALSFPLLFSSLALLICYIFSVSLGNTVLLMTLAASGSYIAVPAAMKSSIPEANPSIYLGLSLGITFPFNLIFGIPLYAGLAAMIL
jgi:hypothetical protein